MKIFKRNAHIAASDTFLATVEDMKWVRLILFLCLFSIGFEAFAGLQCAKLFDMEVTKIQTAQKESFGFDLKDPGAVSYSSRDISVRHGAESGQTYFEISWFRWSPLRLKNRSQSLTPNAKIIGQYQFSDISRFIGPRLFVASSKLGSRHRIRLKADGRLFESEFRVRKNPTFIGFRAIDFRNVDDPSQVLQYWPKDLVEELQIISDDNAALRIFGDIDITFNPSASDLFSHISQKRPLLERLLKNQENLILSESDLRMFQIIYRKLFHEENILFAKELARRGPEALNGFLNQFGFETSPLSKTGQLSMKDFFAEFRRDPTGTNITIPSEPGLFGAGHGTYSHVVQLVALLHKASSEEALIVKKVIAAMTDPNNPELQLAWSGLFNGFKTDGPHTTSWWQ